MSGKNAQMQELDSQGHKESQGNVGVLKLQK